MDGPWNILNESRKKYLVNDWIVLYYSSMGPQKVQPFCVRVNQGVMAMKV